MRTALFKPDVFPIRNRFSIARGAKTQAHVVTVQLHNGEVSGWAESVPYPRYGENVDSVLQQLESIRPVIEQGLSRQDLDSVLEPGAARNALDCALWDMEAKQKEIPVWRLAGLSEPMPVETAYTISLDTPETMSEAASKVSQRPFLKIKLGAGPRDIERLEAVHKAAPRAKLIIDANEGWTLEALNKIMPLCVASNVVLIEQPLPAGKDNLLHRGQYPIPICADESFHVAQNLPFIAQHYDAINIKLDKTGGLSEALVVLKQVIKYDLKIMVGCMVGSSLAMAPAMLLANYADFVDLDGPLLLATDRDDAIRFDESYIFPPSPALWG